MGKIYTLGKLEFDEAVSRQQSRGHEEVQEPIDMCQGIIEMPLSTLKQDGLKGFMGIILREVRAEKKYGIQQRRMGPTNVIWAQFQGFLKLLR